MEFLIAAQIVFDVIVIILIAIILSNQGKLKKDLFQTKANLRQDFNAYKAIANLISKKFVTDVTSMLNIFEKNFRSERDRLQEVINTEALRINTIEGKIFVDRIIQEINKEILEQLKKLTATTLKETKKKGK